MTKIWWPIEILAPQADGSWKPETMRALLEPLPADGHEVVWRTVEKQGELGIREYIAAHVHDWGEIVDDATGAEMAFNAENLREVLSHSCVRDAMLNALFACSGIDLVVGRGDGNLQ